MGDAVESDTKKRRCRIAVSSALLGIGVVLLLLVTVFYVVPKMISVDQFALVFDAGSTHTELTIFKWPPKVDAETAVIEQVPFSEDHATCEVEGDGISSYGDQPEGAGKSLLKCLENAKTVIPPESQKISNVFLGATAGMRLLDIVNHSKAEAVMESVRDSISNSGFKFQPSQAEITLGEDEGASAWISANLILENFQNKEDMMGVLDMGGASTQIAFTIDEWKPSPQLKELRIFGVDYKLYSATFLCFGLSQFITRLRTNKIISDLSQFETSKEEYVIMDSCFPPGFTETFTLNDLFETGCGLKDNKKPDIKNPNANFTFQGEFSQAGCLDQIKNALDNKECEKHYQYCFDKSILPEVKGRFKAVSSFYYAVDFYKFTNRSDKQLRDLTDEKCQQDWKEIQKQNPKLKAKHLRQFCTSGLYVDYILTDVYGFDTNEKWDNISFVKTINDVTLGWQLGYITNISNILPSEKIQGNFITANIYYVLLAVSLVIILAAVFAVYVYCKSSSKGSLPVSFSRHQNPNKSNEVSVRIT